MFGLVSGVLLLWLNNEKWIIKDGWFMNFGLMMLCIDKDIVDVVVKDNVMVGLVINWLCYMEIMYLWMKINVDNLGVLMMQVVIIGKSWVDGKIVIVNLNYIYEENVFMLWCSLCFGDNLQVWFE